MARTGSFRPNELSDLTFLHTAEARPGPYTVHVDEWLTRRKRFHIITRGDGEVVFRSRWMRDILRWLSGEGAECYTIRADGEMWLVNVRASESSEGT